jgi:hypothetical protein
MIEALMLTIFIVTAAIFLALWIDAHLLLHRFVARFPDIADREIPYASDRGIAHPEKALFFYRKKAAQILSAEPALARQRRRLIILTILAILVPALGMLGLILTAVIMSY